MPVIMVVWLRFVMHALVAGAVLLPLRGARLLASRYWRWHVLRALMFVAMTGINFWALQYLQLTVTSSIFFTVPIIIALLAALVFGERLDAARWAAILVAFAGVLFIVRPGSANFHPAMLGALVNAALYAIFMLMTRRLAAYESAETIQYLPAVGAGDRAVSLPAGGVHGALRLCRLRRRAAARGRHRRRDRHRERLLPLPAGAQVVTEARAPG